MDANIKNVLNYYKERARFTHLRNITQEEFDFCINNCKSLCGYRISKDIVFPEVLEDFTFMCCEFDERRFNNIDFKSCSFNNCSIHISKINSCKFLRCSFNSTTWGYSYFTDCDFTFCTFINVAMNGSCFNNVTMLEVRYQFCDFMCSSFTDSKIVKTHPDIMCSYVCAEIVNTDIDIASHVPSEGSFTAWKKCAYSLSKDFITDDNDIYCIVKLTIPDSARRSNAGGTKCRADKAIVEDIQDFDGNSIDVIAHSLYDYRFTYTKGQTVSVDVFSTDRYSECAEGIHFFLDRKDAVNFKML